MSFDYSWVIAKCSICGNKLSSSDNLYKENIDSYNTYCFKCRKEVEKQCKIKLNVYQYVKNGKSFRKCLKLISEEE